MHGSWQRVGYREKQNATYHTHRNCLSGNQVVSDKGRSEFRKETKAKGNVVAVVLDWV
jgi:hypothetical protein